MPEPSDKPKPGPIWNPPEGGADEQRLIAVLAPIIARLCAVPAERPAPKQRQKATPEE